MCRRAGIVLIVPRFSQAVTGLYTPLYGDTTLGDPGQGAIMAGVNTDKLKVPVLYNANVLTLDPVLPRAGGVEIDGSRISRVAGASADGDRGIDCEGRTVMPGFIDAHTHFLAYASSLHRVDCSPRGVSSIEDIVAAFSQAARVTPGGEWVRGTGYEEFHLQEGRHPVGEDLDRATTDRPVRLSHRSGHASVLNTYGMRLANITMETAEPSSGLIDRDPRTGRPTGLFLDLEQWLDQRLEGKYAAGIPDEAVHEASQHFLSMGITTFQDASPSNSLDRWRLFKRLRSEGKLDCRVNMMVGHQQLGEMLDAGLEFGAGEEGLQVGPAKVMLSGVAGSLQPSKEELIDIVRRAYGLGFPVAIHAVEQEEVEAAVSALESLARHDPESTLVHRIEHCSIAPPELQARLTRLNAMVVTQPGFLYESGERYLRTVPGDDVPWLYPVRSLRDRGIRVAAGSDAPVASPSPMTAIYSAVTRRAANGETVAPEQRIPVLEALKMYTVDAACALGQGSDKGSLSPGQRADLVVLSDDPTRASPESIKEIEVEATVIGGRLAWASDDFRERAAAG